jgi:hypothetical protein
VLVPGRRIGRWAAVGAILVILRWPAVSSEPALRDAIRKDIDAAIESSHLGPLAPLASDAEFLRRVSLDLTGIIPTALEVRGFLADTDPAKRERLVERLLASPRHARHLATIFDVTLMERRPEKHIKVEEWQEYLRASCAQRKPFEQLAREVLAVDGADPALRPAARFLLDRDVDPHNLTRDIGRLFFGVDLQCSQCHDHPLIDDYLQADFQGLYAFLQRSFLFTDKEKKVFVAEKADGEAAYHSVFTPDVKHTTRPKLPGGAQLDEPSFEKGKEYTVAPADKVRPVPAYSRRARLAMEATSGSSAAFNRNAANRLWALLHGQGLVHPLDLHHDKNPATHPALLERLARELAATKFDVTKFLKEVALSRTYQRASEIASLDLDAEALRRDFAARGALHEKLKSEARDARKAAIAREAELAEARKHLAEDGAKLAAARSREDEARKEATSAATALASVDAGLKQRQEAAASLDKAIAASEEAAQKLAGDPLVAVALGKLKERAAALALEVRGDTEKRPSAEAAMKSASEGFGAVLAQLQTAAAAHEARRAEVEQLAKRLAEAEALASERDAAAAEALRALEAGEALLGLSELRAAKGPGDPEVRAETEKAASTLRRRFAVAPLKPLSPEQLGWSVLRAAGEVERAEAEAAKEARAAAAAAALAARDEAGKIAAGAPPAPLEPGPSDVERRVHEKLKGRVAAFVSILAGAPGQAEGDFQATAQHALFLLNSGEVQGLLAPANGNLTERLAKIAEPRVLTEELYASVLSRLPRDDEVAAVTAQLAAAGAERAAAVQDLVWSLLASVEFRFNH